MSLSRDSRQIRKYKFILRKRLRIRQGLERIDYEEDVVIPQIEAMLAGKATAELPENAVFDIEIVDEDPTPAPTRTAD